jgi:hypothetical protein
LAVAGEPPNAVGLLPDYGAEGSRPIALAVVGKPPNAVGLLPDYGAEGSRPIVLAVIGERSETFAHHKCINERGRATWKSKARFSW